MVLARFLDAVICRLKEDGLQAVQTDEAACFVIFRPEDFGGDIEGQGHRASLKCLGVH